VDVSSTVDVSTDARRSPSAHLEVDRRARDALALGSASRLAWLAAVASPVIAGVVAAAVTPRGPDSQATALAWLVGTCLVGLVGGALTGSRWSLLLTPAVFAVAFELARAGTQGPTVDQLQLGTTYGLIAVIVGRGFTYLLAILPMWLGSALGLALAAGLGHARARRLGLPGWGLTAIVGVVVVALAVGLTRPATTAPIAGPDGALLEGSIAELTTVSLGGHEQALMIRGRSVEDPVLLHLAGGPGGTDLGAMRADTGLEQDFVVVTWEQRGVGKSYAALDPAETLTLEQMIADTVELSEYLRDRFHEERIYLHGNSWGSTLGVLAAQQRPDLYHAFIGSGQMVSQRATDVMFWEDTLAWAQDNGREALVETLRANGPPPYARILDYEPALSHEHDWNPYPEWDGERELPFTLFVPENTLLDQVNGLRSFLDTFSVLYPQLQDIDFRTDVPRLEVPVVFVAGAHEARGRAVLVEEWLQTLEAPMVDRIVFEHSGHRPSFEEPAEFVRVMRDLVAATYPQGS
jgi:pimeloyl-ACP methyl ester carboxylesterase